MELDVKPQRVKQLLRLKNLSMAQVEKMMLDYANRQRVGKTYGLEGYLRPKPICKMPYDVAKAMAVVLDVPIGFFYYNKVDILFNENIVTINVHESDESVSFPFC